MALNSWSDAGLTVPEQVSIAGEDSFWSLKLDFNPPLVGTAVNGVHLCVKDESVQVADDGCQVGQRHVNVTEYTVDDSEFTSTQLLKVRVNIGSSLASDPDTPVEADLHVSFNVQRSLTNANHEQQLYYKLTDTALAVNAPFTVKVLPYSPVTDSTPGDVTTAKFPDWAIAVIVVGSALIIGGVITLVILMVKRRNKKSDTKIEMK